MSYSLLSKCHLCKKEKVCVDYYFIDGARCGIHQAGQERGHLGSGVITIECQNFKIKDTPEQGASKA